MLTAITVFVLLCLVFVFLVERIAIIKKHFICFKYSFDKH
jgi:hypothetical protein